ncbi:helix-turn-helix transcriptional regulator [Amycolatopsis rhizosphaerae]|uniref:Helix-turn-helix transcriptional regulator n=1 Tax=Amycolatopsis rhizosphaerae TaxID=2053003 RepID=A0A558D731_9PSEU|nr:helix-turn-helix domain-containing protein [Amycolatopsis rhizosphaerae]TVT56834.1 helix-turn-helix transcriptional regulator [Amycolatopsis rhizosphaerae]
MRADARRNYERIVAAAREAFTELGPETAPLDDIARRAHVGAGTLYRHFPSREALMEAVYRDDIERVSNLAYELLETRPPGQALGEWMRAQIAFVLQKRGLATSLKAALDRNGETFASCKTMISEAAAALLKAATEAGAVRTDIEPGDLLRMGHAIGLATEATPEATERLITVVLDGLRPPQGPATGS